MKCSQLQMENDLVKKELQNEKQNNYQIRKALSDEIDSVKEKNNYLKT